MLNLRVLPRGQAFEVAGAILTCAGVLLAIWARALLGRNWSASVAVKQGHRLISAGPYRLVRHPIYSSLLLAVLGTALVVGKLRALAAFACIAFTYCVKSRLEERFMMREFGSQYEEYRRHTRALVPFIF